MIHICIFSGHEGQLRPDKKFYLTIFGGCDLIRPTLARQVLGHRRATAAIRRPRPRTFFLTLFGGVDIIAPTLVEEFVDLRELLNNGVMTMAEYEQALADFDQIDLSVSSLTIFGGLDEYQLPSENKEIEGIALQRHLGNLSGNAGRVLQCGIGQRNAERHATIRQALQAVA